jgi:hypothetical protein
MNLSREIRITPQDETLQVQPLMIKQYAALFQYGNTISWRFLRQPAVRQVFYLPKRFDVPAEKRLFFKIHAHRQSFYITREIGKKTSVMKMTDI